MRAWTSLSAIIPAWNEGRRIGAVLQAASALPLIDQVVVVDDGSTDDTAAIAAAVPGATVIRLSTNGGKTRALLAGIAAAHGSHLLFLDADLQGLTPRDLSALAEPVRQGHADASLSLRGNAPALWRRIGIDYISGERVMARADLPSDLAQMATLPGFGFEAALNRHWITLGLSLSVVPWPGVSSPLKARKHGLRAGLAADSRMMRDILRTIGPGGAALQIVRMRRLAQSQADGSPQTLAQPRGLP